MTGTPTIGDMMAAYAQDAVDHARANGETLDFTPASVRAVEKLLAQLHEAMPRGYLGRLFRRRPSPGDIAKVANMYGGYIGEVIRGVRGGEWVRAEFSPEGAAIALQIGKEWIFPPTKVHKRLTEGAADDVWVYFQILMNGGEPAS